MNKVNVYGSFTQALFFSGGVTAIPKFLLTHYASLKITDQEMILLIHILSELDTNPYPSFDFLSKRMNASTRQIEEMIGSLVERKLLTIDKHWNAEENRWFNSYNIVGLIDELAELWAIEGFKQYQEERSLENNLNPIKNDPVSDFLETLVKTFENELGRPLTELECEHIKRWLPNFSPELIIEALRRGVSAGIRNFRYLDSILREWEKKGLRTRSEVEADDANFQARQEKKVSRTKKHSSSQTNHDKYENFYL